MYPLMDENYWSNRYRSNQTGWDAGKATTPLKQYLDQISEKSIKLLIPGAGNAHEAIYAHKMGFSQVHVLDIAAEPLQRLQAEYPDFPASHLHHENFFDHVGKYDLIVEQTFFCAIKPDLRFDYIKKMGHLLKPDGKLIGVLFDRDFPEQGPPFGGDKATYLCIFSEGLHVVKMERCHNSISPRAGMELFFIAQRKSGG